MNSSKALGDAIAKGIDESVVGQVIKGALLAILSVAGLFIVLVVGLHLYHGLQNHQLITIASEPPNCNYPYVECTIQSIEETYVCTKNGSSLALGITVNGDNWENVSIGEGECSRSPNYYDVKRFCGYSEANAWVALFTKGKNVSLKMDCE